jgi:hypothetical protein
MTAFQLKRPLYPHEIEALDRFDKAEAKARFWQAIQAEHFCAGRVELAAEAQERADSFMRQAHCLRITLTADALTALPEGVIE